MLFEHVHAHKNNQNASSLTSQPAAYLPAVWLWFELPTPSSRDPTFRWVKYIPTIVQGCHHALCTSVNKPTSRATAQTTRNRQEVVTSMDLKEWKVKVEVRFTILPIQLGSIFTLNNQGFFHCSSEFFHYIDLWQTNSMKLDVGIWRHTTVMMWPYVAPAQKFRRLQDRKTDWWLNQPIWKICSSKWVISPGRDENKKYLKPPPRKSICGINKIPNQSSGGFLAF